MPRVRELGFRPLPEVWAEMQAFTAARGAATADEIWLVEHPPVFTLGMRADRAHVLAPGDIPVVQIDRGGQVTYHGPGQLVAYVLLDLRRLALTPRTLVQALEDAVVDLAAGYGVTAAARRDAPGVYVGGKKLAAIGLRVKRYCSYHGLALNVSMDLEPFERINPCGFADLETTDLARLAGVTDLARVRADLAPRLAARFASPADAAAATATLG
ncbi:MAG TPA: lipoyl(octanoyl) transferase LipB [Gammaproteobacteria bacterium]|nr:lipoyl(octanoyl) transferase LipB [Gammaproteobacteria bacterium]